MSKIKEIIQNFRYKTLNMNPLDCHICSEFLDKLEAELSKTKKLYEIFVNNEPNHCGWVCDGCNTNNKRENDKWHCWNCGQDLDC